MLQKDNFGLILIDTLPQLAAAETKFEHKNYSRQYESMRRIFPNNGCETTTFFGKLKIMYYIKIFSNPILLLSTN